MIKDKLDELANKYVVFLETSASKQIFISYHNEVIDLLKKEELIK